MRISKNNIIEKIVVLYFQDRCRIISIVIGQVLINLGRVFYTPDYILQDTSRELTKYIIYSTHQRTCSLGNVQRPARLGIGILDACANSCLMNVVV